MSAGSLTRGRNYLARVLRWLAYRLAPQAVPNPMAEVAAPWKLPDLPSWVADEIRAISHLEPDLLSADDSVEKFQFYAVPTDPATGIAYSQLVRFTQGKHYSHVFLVPWLKPGGADRGTLHHVNALLELEPQAQVLIISTEPSESQWRNRVPDGVDFIEAGLWIGNVDFSKQVTIVTRFLLQLRPPVVHIINSRVGWEAVKRHGLALRQHSKLFASLFCDDRNASGRPVGYAREYLRESYTHFERIFCDNKAYPSIWARALGLSMDSFQVLPFPYDGVMSPAERPHAASGTRVLWAGRLDRQKRPDILARIADELREYQFDVYGATVLGGDDADLQRLRALPNVTLHGTFERLEDVVRGDHVVYLMTTEWEGVPTILFDVAAAGLPICAPDVGGISDFVSRERLIPHPEDVAAFVAELRAYATDSEKRNRACDEQYRQLSEDRTWQAFLQRLESVNHYMAVPAGKAPELEIAR